MPLTIGIDIGITGAIAILTASGELIEVHEMPVLHDGPAGRRNINAPLLAAIIFKSHAVHAFVESVNARPGEGAVGAFAFGRSREAS
jgi:crossover junction endodeoxyribonuclease RuvC